MSEPNQYVWKRDGLNVVGTLQEYANLWSADQYHHEHDQATDLLLWSGDRADAPVIHEVIVDKESTADGMTEFLIRVADECVRVKIHNEYV